MGNILETLNKDLVSAMKSKDSVKADTIRAIKTAIKTVQVAKKSTEELSDAEIIQVIQKQAKQRQDSIDMYKTANRIDLIEKEESELVILKAYLPKEADEVKIKETLATINSTNMGEIIKLAKEVLTNEGFSIDGKILASLVKEKLNS